MSTEDPTPATDGEIPDLDALAEVGLVTEAGESSDAASPDYEASDAAADEAVALSEASSEDEAASLGEAVPATDETSLDEAPSSDEAAAQPEAPQQETPAEPATDSTAESTSDSTNEDQLPPDDPESDLVAAGDENELPDVSSDEALEAALEALLLVVDSPINEESLGDTVGVSVARVTVALRTMAQKFTERASGIDLRRVGEGWRFYTRDTYAPFVEKLLLDGQRSKLTRAALESLAVIAYRQPVTRARVAAVRGVNVDGVIRTLLARGLIEEMGTDPETTGTLYVTTELFLERLGLSSLNDLPPIAPLLPEVDTIDDI